MLKNIYLEDPKRAQDTGSSSDYTAGVKPRKLDFHFYWRALASHKWPIILFAALMTVAAICYALASKSIYSANATLLLESQSLNATAGRDQSSSKDKSLEYVSTQTAILKSRMLAERVIRQIELNQGMSLPQIAEKLDVSVLPSLTAKNADFPSNLEDRSQSKAYNEILNKFRQSVRIKPIAKTKLVKISYEASDPEFAALVANTIASEYIKSGLDTRSAFKDNTSAWMDSRVSELKLKLDNSEEALLSFKETNGLLDLNGGVGRLNEQELLTTSAELAEANSQLSNSRDLLRKIQNFKTSSPELLETLPFVQNDVLIRSVQTQIGQVQRNLVESSTRYGPKHPQIVDGRARLRSLQAELSAHISRTVATFENDYQLLSQRVASLKANLEQGKENFQVLGKKRIALEALENEVTSNREQYKGLFDKILETRATEGLDEANAVVSEKAWVPTSPIKPNKILIIGLTLMGSLLIAAAVSSLLEFLNDTVTSTKDIDERLKTRLLGVLPLIDKKLYKRKSGGKSDLPLNPTDVAQTSEIFAEAVNTCRTALSARNNRSTGIDNDHNVILVTSSEPDEGKSTVALNLANSFGQLDPQELIASDKFARILEFLRKRYDKIIIDCAPTHVVSDAIVLSKLADSVVYVVKPNKTPIKLVYSGLSRLAEAGTPVAGVCLSQVDLNKTNSYGGMEFHGFGVNYQYGSHYNNISQPPKTSKLNQMSEYIPLLKAS